jgi:hypothetical protein
VVGLRAKHLSDARKNWALLHYDCAQLDIRSDDKKHAWLDGPVIDVAKDIRMEDWCIVMMFQIKL